MFGGRNTEKTKEKRQYRLIASLKSELSQIEYCPTTILSLSGFILVHLCAEINLRFYRGKEKEQGNNKNGEQKASRKI